MSDVSAAATVAALKRRRRYVPRDDLLALFELVGRYRVLSTPHAHTLHFAGPKSATQPTLRATQLRIARLQEEGYLATFALPATPPVRFSFLTRAAFERFPALHGVCGDLARKRPAPDVAIHAWTRAALASSAQAAGFKVGRDLRALTALRRFLVDGQRARIDAAKPGLEREDAHRVLGLLRGRSLLQPWTVAVCEGCGLELPVNVPASPHCEECGGAFKLVVVTAPHSCARCGLQSERTGAHAVGGRSCSGASRQVDYLPFDLAWRQNGDGYEVQILLADNPYRSLQAQLDELPLRVI